MSAGKHNEDEKRKFMPQLRLVLVPHSSVHCTLWSQFRITAPQDRVGIVISITRPEQQSLRLIAELLLESMTTDRTGEIAKQSCTSVGVKVLP